MKERTYLIMETSNKTVLDIKKCQQATFGYINNKGNFRHTKPKFPTVNGQEFIGHEICFGTTMTMLEYAKEHKMIDVWTPIIYFQLTANHCITYTGAKALALNKAWREKIFNKKG